MFLLINCMYFVILLRREINFISFSIIQGCNCRLSLQFANDTGFIVQFYQGLKRSFQHIFYLEKLLLQCGAEIRQFGLLISKLALSSLSLVVLFRSLNIAQNNGAFHFISDVGLFKLHTRKVSKDNSFSLNFLLASRAIIR